MANSTVASATTNAITSTMASTAPSSTARVHSDSGILAGGNPSEYDPKNPIILFIIQASIIIIFCRLLHWPLSKIKQPRVIAEVIGGVLLGPSVMGRIPHFSDTIFPTTSLPVLNLAANLGLVLFLFLVGLEVDLRFLVKHWRIAATVGVAGMALPFGLGCAIAWGLYGSFRNEPGTVYIDFPVYMLFVGVAMAITAFPVLCRILTELKLLSTPVGIIVLAAGVGNDVVGWILLALCVALVNSGSGITALWVLLSCVAWILFLWFAIRPVFLKILRRTRSLEDGPSQTIVGLTLLICLASAFFTGVIGVHPIFGAFLAGLMCPHDGGFAIKLTEKIEDLVSTLLLPLYFALSGLSTNLGLLDSGKAWGYVVGVIAVAFLGKMLGGSGAARLNGMVWRECFTIGSLMSCKGLVELIVLNIGLQAKILSQRTFTIFVVMALFTTFVTTPLTSFLYPPAYQKKIESWKRGEIDWKTGQRLEPHDDVRRGSVHPEKLEAAAIRKILIYLRLDSLPTTLAITTSLRQDKGSGKSVTSDESSSDEKDESLSDSISAHGLRLLPLTERDSSVMKVSEVAEYTPHDPVVNTFLAFGNLHGVSTSGEVAICPQSSYATALAHKAHEVLSDLLLLPWTESGSMSEAAVVSSTESKSKLADSPFSSFVQQTFETATEVCHVGVMISGSAAFSTIHDHAPAAFVVPFTGSMDDKLAVRLALQLASNTRAHVHIQDIDKAREKDPAPEAKDEAGEEGQNDARQVAIQEPDDTSSEQRNRFLLAAKASLADEAADRVHITPTEPDSLLTECLEGMRARNSMVIFGRNHDPARPELRRMLTGENVQGVLPAPSCLGALADRLLLAQVRENKEHDDADSACGSLLVVQARRA